MRTFPHHSTFTRGKLARIAGISDDVAAHWVKESLLVPVEDGQGTGSHKEFTFYQVNKAVVLAFLRRMGCNISALRWFSERMERGWEIVSAVDGAGAEHAWRAAMVAEMLNRFDRGEARVFNEGYAENRDEPPYVRAQTVDEVLENFFRGDTEFQDISVELAMKARGNPEDGYALNMYCDLANDKLLSSSKHEAIWLAWPVGSGWKLFHSGEAANLSGMVDEIDGGLYINLRKLMRSTWAA